MRLRAVGVVVGVAAVAVMSAAGAFAGSGAGTITTIAGTGRQGFSGDRVPARSAQLSWPAGVAVDAQGNIYIADAGNNRVRKVSPGGTITTFAGTGQAGFSGDGGQAVAAQLYFPSGVAVDRQGNLYIADHGNRRVRRVSTGGTITTIAGAGQPGFSGDGGPASSARLNGPSAVAVDGRGNVYIADTQNNRVRKVSRGGMITTIAGSRNRGFSGDGGPATSARLGAPSGVAVDARGNVYIADEQNDRVRKVSTGGRITTFAGTGRLGYSGDGGPASSASVTLPAGVAVDRQGSVYIADTANNRVRKVSPGGRITTVAGTGSFGFSGDGGPATSARLYFPRGVAVDGRGNVYIADTQNYRVRKVPAQVRVGSRTSAAPAAAAGGKAASASGAPTRLTVPAALTHAYFNAPAGLGVYCGMSDQPGQAYGVLVMCTSVKTKPKLYIQKVTMGADGRPVICRDSSYRNRCNLGDAGQTKIPTLGYGRQITAGRFRCRVLRSRVECTVISTGNGFLINAAAVRLVGP